MNDFSIFLKSGYIGALQYLIRLYFKQLFSILDSIFACEYVKSHLLFSCRFLLGGDHGRLKFLPPEDFSPLVESLLPQQILSIDPCFYFGNLNKNVLAGPLFVEDDTAFVPVPVDTSMVIFLSKVQPFTF